MVHVQLRLVLILGREENQRTQRKTLELRQLYSYESQVWDSAEMVTHLANDPI